MLSVIKKFRNYITAWRGDGEGTINVLRCQLFSSRKMYWPMWKK